MDKIMCMIVKNKINEWVKDKLSFTSHDITASIREDLNAEGYDIEIYNGDVQSIINDWFESEDAKKFNYNIAYHHVGAEDQIRLYMYEGEWDFQEDDADVEQVEKLKLQLSFFYDIVEDMVREVAFSFPEMMTMFRKIIEDWDKADELGDEDDEDDMDGEETPEDELDRDVADIYEQTISPTTVSSHPMRYVD
jgi:hypothetical protein